MFKIGRQAGSKFRQMTQLRQIWSHCSGVSLCLLSPPRADPLPSPKAAAEEGRPTVQLQRLPSLLLFSAALAPIVNEERRRLWKQGKAKRRERPNQLDRKRLARHTPALLLRTKHQGKGGGGGGELTTKERFLPSFGCFFASLGVTFCPSCDHSIDLVLSPRPGGAPGGGSARARRDRGPDKIPP